MAAWKLRRETLHRIVLSSLFPDDSYVSEDFDVVSIGRNWDEGTDYVIVQ